MDSWKLKINDGALQDLKDLKLFDISLNIVNLEQDDLSLSYDVNNDFIPFGSKVYLYRNETIFYQGKATAPKYTYDPGSESISMVVNGPWSQMSKQRDVSESYDTSTDRLIQNKTTRTYAPNTYSIADGLITSYFTREFIIDILQNAINHGLELELGSIILENLQTYAYTKTNTSVLEALIAALSFHPKSTAWIDYSKETPTIEIDLVGNAPNYQFNLKGPEDVHLDIVERRDLLPRCVIINSLATRDEIPMLENVITQSNIGDDNVFTISQRFVIDENSPNPCKVLNLFPKSETGSTDITADAVPQIGQAQRLKTVKYPTKYNSINDNVSAKKWWSRQIQLLYELTTLEDVKLDVEQLMIAQFDAVQKDGYGKVVNIKGHKCELIEQFAKDPDSRFLDSAARKMIPDGLADVDNQLLAGTVEEWMAQRSKIGEVKVTASVGYRSSTIAAIVNKDVRQKFLDTFPLVANFNGVTYNFNTFSRQFQATNLQTGTYYAPALPQVIDNVDTEDLTRSKFIPFMGYLRNAAMQYVRYLQGLSPWQGNMTLTAEDCIIAHAGQRINILGGLKKWETIDAPINQITYTFQDGITQIQFGLNEVDEFNNGDISPNTPRIDVTANPTGTLDDKMLYIAGNFATPEAGTEALRRKEDIIGPACLSVGNCFWESYSLHVFFATANMFESNPDRQMKKHSILCGSSNLDSATVPTAHFELAPDATHDFWLTWTTDNRGVITGSPTIVLNEPTVGSYQNYIPPSPEGPSQTGNFKCHVYTIVCKHLGETPLFEPRCPIPTWSNFAWIGFNVGGNIPIYKKYDENQRLHQFRSIGPSNSLAGTQPVIINVEKNGDSIIISGGVNPQTSPTYGVSGSLTFLNCNGSQAGKIEWVNGLITTNGNQNIQLGDCGTPCCL